MGRCERAGAGMRQKKKGHGKGREAKSAKQQPRGIGKPVAMKWLTMGQPWGTWPREVGKMP